MQSHSRRLVQAALRFGFRQLYTRFAWTYDVVAAAVSLGEWQAWGRAVIGFIDSAGEHRPSMLLEIGHGPGHLQLALRQAGYHVAGVDLSPQMGAIASRRLRQAGWSSSLARADVYHLPFPSATFFALVSTFPAEFIFTPEVLAEARRVLAAGGQMVVVPTTIPRPTHPLARAVTAWQSLTRLSEQELQAIRQRFEQAGFTFEQHLTPARQFEVVVWVMTRREG